MLRGVAVAGILLANVLVFFGLIFRPPDVGVSLPGAWLDGPVRVAQAVFVERKHFRTPWRLLDTQFVIIG